MVKGIIKDNQVYCPTCNSMVGNGYDYRQVLHEGKSYTEFIKFCSNPKCTEKIVYYSDVYIDETYRYSFDKVEVIKDSGENNGNDGSN